MGQGMEDEQGDDEMRIYAVTKLMEVLEKESFVPDVLVQLAVWLLSEYGYLSPTHALDQIVERLVFLLEQAHQGASFLLAHVGQKRKQGQLIFFIECCLSPLGQEATLAAGS